LLDVVLYSSCLTYCFTLHARLVVPLLLFNLLLRIQHGVLFLLFNLLFYFFCSIYCFAPLVRLVALLFLLNLLFCSSCSTYYSAPLILPFVQVFFFYTRDFLVLFAQRCYFCSFCFILVFSHFTFLEAWSLEELSKFDFFRLDLEGENFCFQFLFVDDFF